MEDELGLIMDVIETKEPREGRELAIKEQDSGSTFNLIFFPLHLFLFFVHVGLCTLTDSVLLQFRDWRKKNTLSNYLERAPGH